MTDVPRYTAEALFVFEGMKQDEHGVLWFRGPVRSLRFPAKTFPLECDGDVVLTCVIEGPPRERVEIDVELRGPKGRNRCRGWMRGTLDDLGGSVIIGPLGKIQFEEPGAHELWLLVNDVPVAKRTIHVGAY